MAGTHEEALLGRDSRLPGLRMLLDGDALLSALTTSWGHRSPTALACHYLRYKPGVNCLAGYAACVGHSTQHLYAKAYSVSQYHRARALAPSDTQGEDSLWIDEACVVVRPMLMDRKLRGARRLFSNESKPDFLRKILPEAGVGCDLEATVVRYKPERRLVASLQRESGALALVKIYADQAFTSAYQATGVFQCAETLRVPRLLGRSRRHRTLVLEWLTGEPLDTMLVGRKVATLRLGRVGRALAELHAQDAAGLGARKSECYGLSVLASANSLAAILPAHAERVRMLAARVVTGVLSEEAPLRPIHGDFHTEQILLGEERVGIIDFDRAAQGDPAVDVGSFLAWLHYHEIRGQLTASERERLATDFLDGYARQAGELRTKAVELHTCARLIQLTSQPFRQRVPEWDAVTDAIIERAERLFHQRRPARMLVADAGSRLRTSR